MPSKRSENRKGHTAKGVDIDKGLNKGRGFAPLGEEGTLSVYPSVWGVRRSIQKLWHQLEAYL